MSCPSHCEALVLEMCSGLLVSEVAVEHESCITDGERAKSARQGSGEGRSETHREKRRFMPHLKQHTK